MRANDFDIAAAIESAQALSSIIELPTLIDQLCQILLRYSGASICIPVLRSGNSQNLWQVYQINRVAVNGDLTLTYLPLAEYPHLPLKMIDCAINDRTKVVLDRNTTNLALLTDNYLALNQPQSAICLPLLSRGELQGIIYLENRYAADVFTDDRQIILESIAAQVVITLTNAQLYEAVTQRSLAMEASIDGMAICEHDRFIYLNRSHSQLYGYSLNELIGQSWQCLHTPADGAEIKQIAKLEIAASGQWRGETIGIRKDGSSFDLELTLFMPVKNKIISISRDITVQKALQQSTAKQQDALAAIVGWGAAGKTGTEFYQASTRYLAQTFDVHYAFLSRLIDDDLGKVQIESFWTGTEFLAPFEMELAGTPCLSAYQNYWAIFPANVQSHFPDATILASLAAESYLGVVIRDLEGNVLANLSIIDTKPLPEDISTLRFIVQLFADRIAAEMIRQSKEDQLVTSQQKYYSLIQSVNGVVWEYDLASNRFTFVSDRAVSLFGYPLDYWLSQPNFWQDCIYPEDVAPTVRTYDEAIEYGYDCEFEYRMVTADDQVIWVYDISTLVRDADGKPISTRGLFIDISDIKQVETDLNQTNARLESTNQQLQQATQLKDAFLATMSHELRTPLNAILGMSQALQEQVFGNMNSRQIKSLSTIERNGQHLLSLINDILDISKIAAGKLELNIAEISLKELCESSLITIEQQASDKLIQLDIHLPEHFNTIAADERRMRQVLINLLTNAVKFTPEGGNVTLAVTWELGTVVGDERSWVCFAVTDTGIGIESSDIAKLGQPFVQIDSTLNRKYEGSGLGLSIVKQIVELHGGIISIDSTVGTGSCFTVKIPTDPSVSQSPSVSVAESPLILLADHHEGTIDSFYSYLTAKGYRIIFAQTGSAAISLTMSERPDIILIDLQIPDIDGFTTIAQIRQQPELAQIPIIALTALPIDGTREQCLTIGATAYMEKPVKLRELNQTIQECLKIINN
jgi:PAS domain S-box-containing protein